MLGFIAVFWLCWLGFEGEKHFIPRGSNDCGVQNLVWHFVYFGVTHFDFLFRHDLDPQEGQASSC